MFHTIAPLKTPFRLLTIIALAASATCSTLHAGEPATKAPKQDKTVVEPAKVSEWEFTIEPYAWLIGMNGTVGVGNLDTHINVSPTKTLQHLDWALFLQGEVRHGKWGLLYDGFFAQLSTQGSPGNFGFANNNVRVQQGFAELAVGYRVLEDQHGFLDIIGGGRYNYIGLKTSANAFGGTVTYVQTSSNVQFPDALIGLRGQLNITSKLYLSAKADIALVSWQANAALGYSFTKNFFVEGGYRFIKTDYNHKITFDVAEQGPFIGLGLKF
jgi:opacity protein-like surface antigen